MVSLSLIHISCAPGSRLGTTCAQWDKAVQEDAHLPELLDGLHFHTLCEQDADALETTLNAVASTFGDLLPKMQWLNFGGGHHITRPDYDMETLERCIRRAQQDWNVTVYLEPGEACALNAGYLLSRVLDVVRNGETTIAILDASAACHMPDVIEMPYRPPLLGAGEPGEKPYTVRLAGPTCLAGDVIGDYSFDAVPAVGDLLVFGDMAIYTTCKNNTFNGMPLPGIYSRTAGGDIRKLASFGYRAVSYTHLPEHESRTAKRFLAQFPELVILKAFTKLYAMAGVRLGYVLSGDEKLLENMREAGQPWAVSSLAQAAGVAALDETEYADHVRSLKMCIRDRVGICA